MAPALAQSPRRYLRQIELETALRRSWPARITALGFVVVIVFGNFAIADIVMGVDIASWTFNGMWIGIGVTVVSGISLAALLVTRKLRRPPEVPGEPEGEG